MANATALRNDTQANPYEGMQLERLLLSQQSVQEEIQALEKIASEIDKALRDRVALAVSAARAELEKNEGTVHAAVEGYDVTSNIPKRVEWDTKKLDAISPVMMDNGYDPADWIDFKLSVSEKKYSAMPKALRELCDTARTIKHGKEILTFTKGE